MLAKQLHHTLTAHHATTEGKKAWSGIGAARNLKCSRQIECWTVSCTTCSQLTTLRKLGQGLVLLGISNSADWTVLDCQLHHKLTAHHTTTEGRRLGQGLVLLGISNAADGWSAGLSVHQVSTLSYVRSCLFMLPEFPSHKNMPVLDIGQFSGGDERYKTDPKHQQ